MTYRCLLASDARWLTEMGNDPEAAKYALSVYPRIEHETEEFVKIELEGQEGKTIMAEVDGEPAGSVGVWWRNVGRDHILDGSFWESEENTGKKARNLPETRDLTSSFYPLN